MINLMIKDEYSSSIDSQVIEQTALAVLARHVDMADTDLSIVIEDDERLHALNKEYLDIDAPTDVLSFPSGEENVDPETGTLYLGDIIISFQRAAEQAAASGHNTQSEIQLLVVHDVLHLLGYDHAVTDEKAEMWSIQADILKSLGVQIARLPE